jgi:hypothetical protein
LRCGAARDLTDGRSDHGRNDHAVRSERRRLRCWQGLKRGVGKYEGGKDGGLLMMVCEVLGILSVATIAEGGLIIALPCKLLLPSKKN